LRLMADTSSNPTTSKSSSMMQAPLSSLDTVRMLNFGADFVAGVDVMMRDARDDVLKPVEMAAALLEAV